MWPEVEDLLWRVRSGALSPESIVLASHIDPTVESAWARWGLDDATWGYFDVAPGEIVDTNPWQTLYDDGFVLSELPSAAHHPTDYLVDAQGLVYGVEREYRGAHELPWTAGD
jgi:hypothetical protein